MRLFLHGDPNDCERVKASCQALGAFDFTVNHHEHLVAEALLAAKHDAAIVVCDGAAGMEAAMTVRRTHPALPLIWFSDDAAFGVQAYRLDVAYFAEKSHITDRLDHALRRAGMIK